MKPIIVIMSLLSFMISAHSVYISTMSVSLGPLLSTISIILVGFLSYYSCYLYLEHLGNYPDMDDAFKYHFWDSNIAKSIYNLINFLFFLFYIKQYYLFVIFFWDTILPNQNSILNPLFNAIGIIILVCVLRYFQIATKVLAFGTVLIFISSFFFVWVLASVPQGNKKPPLLGTGMRQYIVSMGLFFEVQEILIPILRYLPKNNAKDLKKYTIMTYIVASCFYIFLAFSGCYGLINRPILNPLERTIDAYFPADTWYMKLFYCLNALILYFSFGEFISLANRRFFAFLGSIFSIKKINEDEFFSFPELIFISCLMGLYLGLKLGDIQIQSAYLIESVWVFIYFYFFPAILQFKCIYFARPKAIFNIVFKGSIKKSVLQIDERKAMSIQSASQQNKEKQKKEGQIKEQLLQKCSLQKEKPQKLSQGRDTPQVQEFIEMKQFSNFYKEGFKEVEKQPRIQSYQNSQKGIKIETINELCPAKLPVGMWRVFDLLSILLMVSLGMFIMIESF